MRKMMLVMFAVSMLAACGLRKSSDQKKSNVARDNAMVSFPDAKCDEVGFQEETLHSVRCTLKNGVRVYCWASMLGTDCKSIYAPDEVIKAQADAQRAQQAQQQGAPQPPMPPSPAPQPMMPPAPPQK